MDPFQMPLLRPNYARTTGSASNLQPADYEFAFSAPVLATVFVAGGTADAMPLRLILRAPAHWTVAVDQ